MYTCETQIPERNHISNSLDFSLEISTVLVVLRLAVKAFILGSLSEADFSVHFIVFMNSLYRIIIIKTHS